MSKNNKDIFAKNLSKQITQKHKSRREIATEINVSYSTLTDWINGNKFPRIEKINMLAEYFGISKSELIEDFEDIKKDNERLASIIVKLRTNKELLDIVERLASLDKLKLESLTKMIDSFL